MKGERILKDILMKCGHSANGERVIDENTRIPACVICGCTEIEENKPDLTGRKARCSYFGRTFTHKGQRVTCHGEADSKYALPFFEHKPNNQYDTYYCGCFGWD
jgi:hypothetical protein